MAVLLEFGGRASGRWRVFEFGTTMRGSVSLFTVAVPASVGGERTRAEQTRKVFHDLGFRHVRLDGVAPPADGVATPADACYRGASLFFSFEGGIFE